MLDVTSFERRLRALKTADENVKVVSCQPGFDAFELPGSRNPVRIVVPFGREVGNFQLNLNM